MYGYVYDPNRQFDVFGLDSCGPVGSDKSKIWQDKNGRWRNPNGTFAKHPGWPENFGFVKGGDKFGTLPIGHKIDRFGHPNGVFVADAGTPFGGRALPADNIAKEFNAYEVVRPIDGVRSGPAEPWFGQKGGGIQHQLLKPVQYYIDNGSLIKI